MCGPTSRSVTRVSTSRRSGCCGALGLLETHDFPSWTAAPLLDIDVTTASDTLDALVDAQLLEVVGGFGVDTRYRLHDLVRRVRP